MIPEAQSQKTPRQIHQQGEAKPLQTQAPGDVHANRRSPRLSSRRRRDIWLPLIILLLCLGTIVLLANISVSAQRQATVTQPASLPTSPISAPPTTTASKLVRATRAHLYPFPQANAGLMQPAVDGQGKVWVGEMFANRLARLDSHTGAVSTWKPPGGKNGLMSTAIDAQGKVWFVEQGANYIGSFDPARQMFRIFPLGRVQGRPMGPQDLQFDVRGNLWFTAAIGGRIGRLDPNTGALQTWPVPAPRAGATPAPFSLTVTRDGQVWFAYITGGAVGRLDPATGHVTLYPLADPQTEVFSIAHDAHGRIWFTEIVPGKLGMIDSTTGKVTEASVLAVAGHPAALYGLVIAPDGTVWFANNGASALVRYAPTNASFTFFQLEQVPGGLYGLTSDAAGTLWFTISGTATNAVGAMKP